MNNMVIQPFRYFIAALALTITVGAKAADTSRERALWASVCGDKNAVNAANQQYLGKVLVSWRMLPDEDETTGYHVWRLGGRLA